METINNERVVFFDVDGTLLDVNANRELYNKYKYNIDQVKRHKERGFFVVIWSANGYDHAFWAVERLGLTDYVDQIMTKPNSYFDDKDANDWMKRVHVDG